VVANQFYLHVAILSFLNVIFAVSLAVIARTGQLSLSHAAFIGVGAYASVLVVMRLDAPFLAGLVASIAVTAALAAVLGWVILRLRGVYFVLVTFAFGEVVRLILLDQPTVSGGANGITGIPAPMLLGVPLDTKARFYALALSAAVLVVIFAARLLASPAGRAFDAIAQNPDLSESVGIDIHRYQVLAFVVGSAIAGGGGALLAHYIRYISPESFTFWESVTFIIMVVVGGRTTLAGPIVGAAFITPLPELLRGAQELQHVIYGAILILVLRFLPAGIASVAARRKRSDVPTHSVA
jgi:branched-chain amino acid transport system permease protein